MVPVDEREEAEDESSSGVSGSSGSAPASASSSASLKSDMALSFALAHLRWRSLILSGGVVPPGYCEERVLLLRNSILGAVLFVHASRSGVRERCWPYYLVRHGIASQTDIRYIPT